MIECDATSHPSAIEQTHLCRWQTPEVGGVLDCQVDHAGPAVAAEDGGRCGELAAMAVVERNHDRVGGQASAEPPVVGNSAERHDVKPCRASQRICAAKAGPETWSSGYRASAGGSAMTWYVRIGTGSDVGSPEGAARLCRALRVFRGRGGGDRRGTFDDRGHLPAGRPRRLDDEDRAAPSAVTSNTVIERS